MDFLLHLFDTSGFPERWRCGTAWKASPALGWLHILSDLGVWSAYLAIPVVLVYFIRQRKDLPFRKIFLLFGAFIFACGTTHLMEAIIFWWPLYRLAGLIKLATAIVSWTTVFALVQVAPKALAMRSPEELQREIRARQDIELQLQRMNADLELRVAERTSDLARSTETLRQERELLQTTLRSIGDAVIVTDPIGNVTFLNQVAEQMTGWHNAEAIGRSLDKVFHIINEQTRQLVDNPALRALHERVIVGLANHTILVARDGREMPIDDSAAPIRGNGGTLQGSVLVFRDISDRKLAEKARHQSELRERERAEELDAVLRATPTPIWISHDRECLQVTGNPASYRLLHMREGENVSATPAKPFQRTFHELKNGEPVSGLDLPLQQAAMLGQEIVGAELTIVFHDDGETRHLYGNASPLRDSENEVRGAVAAFVDITEFKRSSEALRDADRRKDEFLATLAHELRNPLAPIRNSLEVMKQANDDADQLRDSRDMIERQLTQLVRLVDDLLDISRITRNKVELRKEQIELASVIDHAIEMCQPLITTAGHRLTVDVPRDSIYLNGDSIRLVQVFSNLLNNACKFTAPGGDIHLIGSSDGVTATILVRDNGIGIPPQMLTNIFDMFTQVDSSVARSYGGLGIGLTLVKSLVEMHGGSVHAVSGGSDPGSVFVIKLPVAQPTPSTKKPAVMTTDTRSSSKRILIVDDNRDAAFSLGLLLRHSGHQIDLAHDGKEAIQHAFGFKPDVILLDIGLPQMNGYEVCQAIREQSWGTSIVIIALTGWGQDDDKRKAKEAGFDEHLVKPVDIAYLTQLLNSKHHNSSVMNSPGR